MRKLLAFITVIITALAGAPTANAHASIVATVPKANSTIKTLPPFIYIEFDGNLLDFAEGINSLQVTDTKGKRVDTNRSLVGGARLSTSLKSGVKKGRYKVSYRIVSEDGHPVSGAFFFTYK